MLALIDYGMGNIRSVQKAFEFIGVTPVIVSDSGSLKKVEDLKGIILPGVGAFGDCMMNLRQRGLDHAIEKSVSAGIPYLGICLGFQILFESSEESPGVEGLGIFRGMNKRFPEGVKIPHMGWNRIQKSRDCPVLKGIEDKKHFYFVHSYYVYNEDMGLTSTVTDYNITFTSSISRDNLFACQFHPEKSQDAGLQLLENFIKLCS